MASHEGSSPPKKTQAAGSAPAAPAALPDSDDSHWLAGIWRRTREHKVVQWTLAYAAFGYTALHGMQMAREAFEWPLAVSRVTLLCVLLGVPIAATLAWYHGYRGRHRISTSELSILTVLLLIAGTLLWRFSGSAHEQSASSATARTSPPPAASASDFVPPPHSVAVLPFVNMSADKEQEYFSDGLSEELVNALALIDQLQVKLLGNETDKIEVGGTRNPQAYDAYLRATQLYSNADTEALYRPALAAFDQAIALDSSFSAAYVGRVFSLLGIGNRTFDLGNRAAVLKEARGAAERAVALAPDSGEAHLAVAAVCQRTLEFSCAAAQFDRALALAPGNVLVQSSYARFAGHLGRRDAAQTAARRAVRLDPQNYASHLRLAQVLHDIRLYDAAIAAAEDAKALKPEMHGAEQTISESYLALGRNDLARQRCESLATVIADDDRHWCLALAYHALGMQVEASGELHKLKALGWGEARAVLFADLYSQWGDKRTAMDWLATAERTRASALETVHVSWLLDPLRTEPEFKALEFPTVIHLGLRVDHAPGRGLVFRGLATVNAPQALPHPLASATPREASQT